ncbi:beta-galactosidase [Bernardetia sp.]|uniref:beta-galactosidase n=1 Tax=Bernardetia sp. TaxID=1937974 RepID=UPI0025B9AFBF|nr:beta-galactosidase [Bernardetia sp.]
MKIQTTLFLLLISFIAFSCSSKDTETPTPTDVIDIENPIDTTEIPIEAIFKPKGVFSSSGSHSSHVLNHDEVRGVLVRALWKDIEPTEGNFDFSSLDQQINAIKAQGKQYSLALIAGGIGTPDWLITEKNVPYFNYMFRGTTPYKLPLIWDSIVLEYLGKLADRLADKYDSDSSLVLVYIPQMTANGIEGHLNGFDKEDFENAGYTETKWINASLQNAKKFASVFPQKALAFEVHELFSSTNPASTIIHELWNDTSLNQRVGAAMWWISGKTTYQSELIQVLENFEGDIYCQVIQRSDKTSSFPNGDYSKVFEQAKQIKARYIEPWEYEFTINDWNTTFQQFNLYADTLQ